MKKYFLGITLLFLTMSVFACDICGCAANAFSVGMLPNSSHHIVGIRYSTRSFESQPAPDGHGFRGVSSQYFTTSEVFGRFKLTPKIQLQAYLPYVMNQKTDSITTKINGIGDLVGLFNYVFIDNVDTLGAKFRHSGTVGLGMKAPTGQFFKLGFEEINMLPGTGSFDFLLNVNYSVQFRNFGIQNESGFTYKTENKYEYRFGNALSISQMFFYRWNINSDLRIIPQLGVNYMYNWMDHKGGELSEDTFNGGDIYNGQINLFVLYKNFGLNAQAFIPLSQQLNRGYVHQKSMFRISINYFIETKNK